MRSLPLCFVLVVTWIFGAGFALAGEDSLGQTRIARWHGDKTACFLLMFDDSWPSAWQVAAPELAKRGMIATFYLNPGKGEYKKFAEHWEQELWKQGMVYGNHTLTHQGVKDFADADHEIGECTRIIQRIVPGKTDRLISYAQPGVGPGKWNITPDELKQLLAKYHLIDRGDIRGKMAVFHLKTLKEMLELADRTIENKGVDFIVIHGVERITPDWHYQDFWALKQSNFLPFLDSLKERETKGQLWITDHISSHQYATERDTASVKAISVEPGRIVVDLTCSADAALYDLPLTLVTHCPSSWKSAKISQGNREASGIAREGQLRFDATPNAGPITLTPVELAG